MAYATLADLTSRYGTTEIARLSTASYSDTVAVDTVRVGVALDDATGVIDSYLRAQYHLPLAPVPQEIVSCCCQLARYNLAVQGEGRSASEAIAKDRDLAIGWLRDLAKGVVQLSAGSPDGLGASGAQTSDRTRILSTDSLGGYV
jgi:phage gp36-like protein